VLCARGADGGWSAPAFYSIGSGSIGLQAGYEKSEVIFLVMTDKGLEQILKSQFKLGADASVAVGPKGGGIEAATTLAAGADIYSFARAKGAFLGASFEGSVISSRESRNKAYYGKPATARDIVVNRKFSSALREGAAGGAGAARARGLTGDGCARWPLR
jgi:lipid-binding SYLF domain-containing protein